jgi:cell fate (sporulation/competence/biofilm development) regulator YlbF (YheA/YmcA/DUF963 family)
MATTQEIVKAAQDLGKLIATHDAAKHFEQAMHTLEQDVEAQRALSDLNRLSEKIAQKEAQGQPIEVAEKRQMDQLRSKVIANAVLQQVQMAQMDYLDLMRKVDEAMGTGAPGEAAIPGAGAPGAAGRQG